MRRIKLGERVRDKVTGFEGIVECISDWRNGCRRYSIAPTELDKDGRPQKLATLDEPDVERVKDSKKIKETRATGGPRPDPVR